MLSLGDTFQRYGDIIELITTLFPLLRKEGMKGIRVKLRNNNQSLIRVESVMSPAGGGAGGGLNFFAASTTPSL